MRQVQKVIITVIGKDCVGIMAKVCTYLADHRININDISQTIVSGYFNMMMIADMSDSTQDFDKVEADLEQIGEQIGVRIKLQREEIFNMMHRV